jgi:ribonuclease PH
MPEPSVPPFLLNTGKGWITAEYSMLPSSTPERKHRSERKGQVEGRIREIQRLIGRSLRSVVDLDRLGPRTIWIDCDVLQADGGTRTAAITGAFIALHDTLLALDRAEELAAWPLRSCLAAVSVGIVGGVPLLDLSYEEDFRAHVDMNVVMTDERRFIEIQGTGESLPFTEDQLSDLLSLARKGIRELIGLQREILEDSPYLTVMGA